jgi:hypothetical protein
MHPGFASYAVGLVGVVKGLKLLAGTNQRLHQIDRILKVNVVVAGAVDQQEFAFQLIGVIDR